MLLLNIYLYFLFLAKLHPFPLHLLIYFTLNSTVPGIGFSIFKKGLDVMFSLLRNQEILEQVEKPILWKNNQRGHRVDFDEKNHAFPMW